MRKSNLYICGDSFVDWDNPEVHWIDYLENHYNVIKLGRAGADNHSILYQIGRIPDYESGDRLVVVFTAPGRFPRRYFGERKTNKDVKYIDWRWYENHKFAKELMDLRVRETESWLSGERDSEILTLKKMKKFMSSYLPIFVTWNDDFYQKTSDFVDIIKVTSISDEGGDSNDWHPGWSGCYQFYLKIHSLLGLNEPPVEMSSKINKIL